MKQSSVEYLAIQLWENMNMQGDGEIVNKIFERAKEMHKEEIEDAWVHGAIRSPKNMQHINNANLYYIKTFEGDNNEQ